MEYLSRPLRNLVPYRCRTFLPSVAFFLNRVSSFQIIISICIDSHRNPVSASNVAKFNFFLNFKKYINKVEY